VRGYHISWQTVIIALAVIVTANVIIIYAGYEAAAPLVNMIGLVLIGLFAKDSVDQNKETRATILDAHDRVVQTANRVYDLASDVEHQRTILRIAVLEKELDALRSNLEPSVSDTALIDAKGQELTQLKEGETP
jgi:hypothetical protein